MKTVVSAKISDFVLDVSSPVTLDEYTFSQKVALQKGSVVKGKYVAANGRVVEGTAYLTKGLAFAGAVRDKDAYVNEAIKSPVIQKYVASFEYAKRYVVFREAGVTSEAALIPII